MAMTKGRAKNLNEDAIGVIVAILDGWSGKLTWDLLIDMIERRLLVRYTRQALDKRARVKMAYQVAKQRVGGESSYKAGQKPSAVEAGVLSQRVSRLEAENSRLKIENERLLEQFVTWGYNAYLKGLTKEYLNTPLPRVDREVTKVARHK
ncbi:hypothetical protein [Pseudomonas sp. PONIH3]|jgi:hypothetical protein|uniref:hypothetical protein n=1 Tax=Pseudomonas sp. PONIH3 TaxID=1636610 RepID=UPI000CDC6744|nr:hypothetical protein [Pseudomonas sp. PONIH3]AUY34349.1 hypothetical protein C3F42_14510 [Pseudomonas sp. PONIH3]